MNASAATPGTNEPLDLGTRMIILCGGLLATLALTAIASVLPQIQTALAHSPGDGLLIKQLIGIVALAMVVGAPLAGFLLDRLGVRRVLIVASLIYAVTGTCGLFLTSLPVLLATRFFVGATAAAIQIASMTIINTRLSGNARAKWLGAHISVAMFSTLIVHPVAGFLGEYSWRWPFALYGGAGLLFALFAWSGKRDKPVAAASPKATTEASTKAGPKLMQWFPFRYLALSLIIGGITFLPMIYAPFLIRQTGVTSPSTIAFVLTADSLVGAIFALLYGRSQRYLSTTGAFIFCFACTGAGTLIAAIAPGFVGIFIGLMVFGLGIGWMTPNLIHSLAGSVTTDQQARAVGLVNGAHFLAAPLCVGLVEPIARRFGPQGAMLLVSMLAFAMLAATGYRLVAERRRGAHLVARSA